MNRLARERSPYLLQHAGNPVDWYPWGDDAFARARAEDKPIFLSVGYSTCHWCHVMEHESFENDAIASALNESFVSIKVDREERPDVDRVYMLFVQASTGSGGWPMSVWLTPDLKPFYGGTYFPPSSKWGRPGFVEILTEIARVWKTERAKVAQSADALTAQLKGFERVSPTWTVPGADALRRTVEQFASVFDSRHGGFGDAPKFPRPSELLFLLREHARARQVPDSKNPQSPDSGVLDLVLRTLRAMALGGMRDHVGGGFHRYSVDAAWRVPHFEKMLYDQAQLALAFIEAAQASGDAFYADVAEDTLLYVMREMTDASGGFHSAEDADSVPPETAAEDPASRHKMEGAYYLWTAGEIDAMFGGDALVVARRFGIAADGNAPQDPQQEFTGKNLLYVAESIDDIARATGRTPDEVIEIVNRARRTMYEVRVKRPHPHRDDKVLTAWNGLMIAALARMARVLGGLGADGRTAGAPYLESARRAATFLRDRMWNPQTGVLLRIYRAGSADIPGYAEDYSFLIFGLLELFQADGDPAWLDWAIALQRRQDALFWDEEYGGWFSTDGRDSTVLLRMKEEYDGAEPTASSVSAMNLLWLSHLVDDREWRERLSRTLRFFGSRIEQTGRAVPMMAAALSTQLAGVQQIVLVEGVGDDRKGADLARVVALRYLPFAMVLRVSDAHRAALAASAPLIAAMAPVGESATVYVCRDFACRRPATSVAELEEELGSMV